MEQETMYRLVPYTGKAVVLSRPELDKKVKALRLKKVGYFIYEVVEPKPRERLRFICGWNMRA